MDGPKAQLLNQFQQFFLNFSIKHYVCFFFVILEKKENKEVILICFEVRIPHFLYRFLEGKKTTRSQFSVPGLLEIHRNLKQEFCLNSREFLAIFQFCQNGTF